MTMPNDTTTDSHGRKEIPGIYPGDPLSGREISVLHAISRGLNKADIARELGVAEGTVRSHVARMLRKLDVHDRAHAVSLGYQLGYLLLDQPETPEDVANHLRRVADFVEHALIAPGATAGIEVADAG